MSDAFKNGFAKGFIQGNAFVFVVLAALGPMWACWRYGLPEGLFTLPVGYISLRIGLRLFVVAREVPPAGGVS